MLLALLKCSSSGEYIVIGRKFVKTSGASWTRPLRGFSIVAPSIKVGVFECVKPRLGLAYGIAISIFWCLLFIYLFIAFVVLLMIVGWYSFRNLSYHY